MVHQGEMSKARRASLCLCRCYCFSDRPCTPFTLARVWACMHTMRAMPCALHWDAALCVFTCTLWLRTNTSCDMHVQTGAVELAVAEIPMEQINMMVKFNVLDCAGHPSQTNLVESILGSAHPMCCLVYSVTDPASFQAVRDWHSRLSTAVCNDFPQTRLSGVLVATKTDLPAFRHQVTSGLRCAANA